MADADPLPTGIQLTVMDPVQRETPHVHLDALRAHDPVHRDEQLQRLYLTRAADVAEVLRDRSLSANPDNAAPGSFISVVLGSSGILRSMLTLDDPDHKRLRALVTQAFNARAIEAVRPRISEVATELLDAIGDATRFDLIAAYASPLPTIVIAEMLGVDLADRDDFRRWSAGVDQAFSPLKTPAQREVLSANVAALSAYFERVVEQRRGQRGIDLVSALVAAEEDGDRLSTPEIVVMCRLLLVAGNITTTDLIGNGVHALLTNPEELARLRLNPLLIVGAVEEMLRFDPPVTEAARTATGNRTIAGVPVARGASIMTSLLGAGHDPAVNPDPHRFDVTRSRPQHWAFGGGAHFCLGAPLARAEAEIGIAMLLAKYPRLRLDDTTARTRKIAPAFNGFEALWLETGAA